MHLYDTWLFLVILLQGEKLRVSTRNTVSHSRRTTRTAMCGRVFIHTRNLKLPSLVVHLDSDKDFKWEAFAILLWRSLDLSRCFAESNSSDFSAEGPLSGANSAGGNVQQGTEFRFQATLVQGRQGATVNGQLSPALHFHVKC